MIVDMDGAYAYRSSCIKQVARFQREELRDVGYQLIDFVEHLTRTALLHRLPIDVQVEV